MILRDWREADASLLGACYERERRSWREDLGWDTAWTWATIEHARVTRGLPGLIAVDAAGMPRGWSFYMRDGATLHLGGLVASSSAVTIALLEAMLDIAGDADRAACFIRDRAPALDAALERRGFDTERFLYLSRPLVETDASLAASRGRAVSAGTWSHADLAGAARLMRDAYGPDAGRHFAPDATLEGWTQYMAGVAGQRGCGTFDPSATRLVRTDDGLQALALVTSIAPDTAHLAQLVVHPDSRGHGVASDLLRGALASALHGGKTSMTLLVSERNLAARRLYERAGFETRGAFVAAQLDLHARGIPLPGCCEADDVERRSPMGRS